MRTVMPSGDNKEHNVKRNSQIGILGGIMIALAALMTGNGFAFASANLKTAELLVLFAAGVGVIVFILMHNFAWASYSAIAAATIALIWVVSLFGSNGGDLSVRLVILVIGAVLALVATVSRRR